MDTPGIQQQSIDPLDYRLSVVVPALNEEDNIASVLERLQSQTVEPDEIIVVDNSSDDNTREIAKRYTDKVFCVDRDKDLGEIRDIGVRRSSGDIIFSTDADTRPPIDWIERLIGYFSDPEVSGVSGGLKDINKQLVEDTTARIGGQSIDGIPANSAFRKKDYIECGGYEHETIPLIKDDGQTLFKKLPRKTIKDNSVKMPVKAEGWKYGLLPMLAISSITLAGGYLLRRNHRNIGNTAIGLGSGNLIGELGHHYIEPSIPNGLTINHDIFGLLGLATTGILDLSNTISDKSKYPLYGLFGGVTLHHILTEGFTPYSTTQRYRLGDNRYDGKTKIEEKLQKSLREKPKTNQPQNKTMELENKQTPISPQSTQQPPDKDNSTDRSPTTQVTPDPQRSLKTRPLVGGVQISTAPKGNRSLGFGTSTLLARDIDSQALYLVSNDHVLFIGGASIGDPVTQPAFTGAETLEEISVATLDRGAETKNGFFISDSARAKINNPETVKAPSSVFQELLDTGDVDVLEIDEWRNPTVGDKVFKYGATTGVTVGEVIGIDETQGKRRNTFVVSPLEDDLNPQNDFGYIFSNAGDSGSPILTEDGVLLGQHWGGFIDQDTGQPTGNGLGHNIDVVLETLNIEPIGLIQPTQPTQPTNKYVRDLGRSALGVGIATATTIGLPELLSRRDNR